jgi:hypothetical protein
MTNLKKNGVTNFQTGVIILVTFCSQLFVSGSDLPSSTTSNNNNIILERQQTGENNSSITSIISSIEDAVPRGGALLGPQKPARLPNPNYPTNKSSIKPAPPPTLDPTHLNYEQNVGIKGKGGSQEYLRDEGKVALINSSRLGNPGKPAIPIWLWHYTMRDKYYHAVSFQSKTTKRLPSSNFSLKYHNSLKTREAKENYRNNIKNLPHANVYCLTEIIRDFIENPANEVYEGEFGAFREARENIPRSKGIYVVDLTDFTFIFAEEVTVSGGWGTKVPLLDSDGNIIYRFKAGWTMSPTQQKYFKNTFPPNVS